MFARISQIGLEALRQKLRNIQTQAIRQGDADSVAENIGATILLRVRRGTYLTPGGGTRQANTYSKGHERRRAKLGLPTTPVSLFMGQVGVLEALRARSRQAPGGKVAIEAGYLPGISEARATEIAEYLNTKGAGKNRVTYKFIGLTNPEQSRILDNLRQRILGHLNQTLT